jgi:ferric enterobactin receptor
MQFATVSVTETDYTTYTDASGYFTLSFRNIAPASLTISVSTVGKQTQTRVIPAQDFNREQLFLMQELSLSLKNVTVTSQRKQSTISNSSILFDRQTLDQLQAFSLADVLNNLPGKTVTAPDLQYRQNIVLRSAASANPVQQAINSMGVAIYVDGIRQSNDANMQNRNVGALGANTSVITNRKDPKIGSIAYDTPFSGLDIRNIPVDNIESIEVVSGVASAKYGELTDGAIIINRKAGQTDYLASMRLNGSSTNASLSKGFLLGKKTGAVNFNINYLNSIQNPTDDLKFYNRVNGGLMWTVSVNKSVRNTFSADYSYKMDKAKIDPDDGAEESMFAKERKIGLTNRTSFQLNQKWLNRANLALSFDAGYQETYKQRYNNSAPIGVTDKDTTGIYEGYFIPGNFTSINHILGKPYNASANLDFSGSFQTGKIRHGISYGANAYLSGNTGKGVLADPAHPVLNIFSGSYKSERPYNFDLQKDIINFGFFAEDRLDLKVIRRELSLTAGLRYDLQNGYPSIQPRINGNFQLSRKWALRASFGIATKAPSMAYRYPGPTYFDIPLINAYNGNTNESLYLLYTLKNVADNSKLRPSRSTQLELGVSADYGFFNTSLYGYYKQNRDGFNSTAQFTRLDLPIYTYTLVPGSKPVYHRTDSTKLYGGLSENTIGNNVQSKNLGIEWFVSTKKIPSLQTSFNFNTSVSYSRFDNTGSVIQKADDSYFYQDSVAWYGIYPGNNYKNLSIMSKIASDTHIPKLGFVVSLVMDVYWKNFTEYLGQSIYPVAYIDNSLNPIPITNFDSSNKTYGHLLLKADQATRQSDPPFVYTSLSLRIAKEIRKKVRVSIAAYNFLDTEIKYFDPVTNDLNTYSTPVSVSAELSIKF